VLAGFDDQRAALRNLAFMAANGFIIKGSIWPVPMNILLVFYAQSA